MIRKEAVSLKYRKEWLGLLKNPVLKNVDNDKYAIFLFGSAVNNLLRANDIDVGKLGEKILADKIKFKIIEEVLAGFIDDKNYIILLEMIDSRNKLSHLYNEKIYEEINKRMKTYLKTIIIVVSILQDKKKIV